MSMKSITALGFATALIAFGAATTNAHANASSNAIEAHESTVPRHDAAPSGARRVTFHRSSSSVRTTSFHRFHRSSVRNVSLHRHHHHHHRHHHHHHFARANVRIGGGHRATPARLHSPRLTHNTQSSLRAWRRTTARRFAARCRTHGRTGGTIPCSTSAADDRLPRLKSSVNLGSRCDLRSVSRGHYLRTWLNGRVP